jgi:hypothetical protein
MIKFFRHIRKRLLAENRFSRYLIYAIGEIILVVIGILIALQINNWNESQKLTAQEQNYLKALQKEFEYNSTVLKNLMTNNSKYADAALELIQYMGPNEPQLSEKEFSKLFYSVSVAEVVFHPSNGVLDEIISSGKLDLFKSQELKTLLSSWGGHLDKVRFQETELAKYRYALLDQWNEEGNPRQGVIDAFEKVYDLPHSKFDIGNRHLLTSPKFDSNLTAFIFSSRAANKYYYGKLEEEIDTIIEIISTEING